MTDEHENSLVPVEQKTIVFYDDELTAVRVEEEGSSTVYVPVRRLAENLGLTWPSQRNRINRDNVLREGARGVFIMNTPGRGGGTQEMTCLPIDLIPGWLFGIQTSRVKEEIRPKLERYRRECFRVLWDAFKTEVLPAVEAGYAAPSMEMTPAERALATIEALHTLAKQQVELERWLGHHDTRLNLVEDATAAAHERLDRAAAMVGDQSRRLQRIELTLTGGEVVTDAQAAAISEAVKAVAFELGKRESEKGNPYQRVYSELYRKFRVPSYKALPLTSFPAVMQWLTEWWRELTGKVPPFEVGES
jgi:hypothetical protein